MTLFNIPVLVIVLLIYSAVIVTYSRYLFMRKFTNSDKKRTNNQTHKHAASRVSYREDKDIYR